MPLSQNKALGWKTCVVFGIFHHLSYRATVFLIFLLVNLLLSLFGVYNTYLSFMWKAILRILEAELKIAKNLQRGETNLRENYGYIYIYICICNIYIYIPYVAFIPLHSCDYLKQTSIKTNVATDEGNGQSETWYWTNDKIAVAVQSWPWVWVELMAW